MQAPRTKAPVEVEPDLTRRQTAIALNASLSTVDQLIRDGRLESYKLGEGRRTARRIRPSAIEAFRARMSGGAQ